MKSYDRLIDIIVKLRSPEGCPWDREQTPALMGPALIEEAYELIEAVDNGDFPHIAEEIGDLVLVASMIAYMYEQEGRFNFDDIYGSVSDKLIRRHPHVFSDVEVSSSHEAIANWEKIKSDVEGRVSNSMLDGVPASFPPLERAFKMQKKAAKAGFDWPDVEPVFEKLTEEKDELLRELDAEVADPARVSEECGDLLFTVVNLCRKLGCDPSIALDRTNRKFKKRFKYVESEMNRLELEMTESRLELMDRFWNEAKSHLKD